MADDFVKERLTQIYLAVPQRGLIGLAFVPPELAPLVLYGKLCPQPQTRPAGALTALACKIAPICLIPSLAVTEHQIAIADRAEDGTLLTPTP